MRIIVEFEIELNDSPYVHKDSPDCSPCPYVDKTTEIEQNIYNTLSEIGTVKASNVRFVDAPHTANTVRGIPAPLPPTGRSLITCG